MGLRLVHCPIAPGKIIVTGRGWSCKPAADQGRFASRAVCRPACQSQKPHTFRIDIEITNLRRHLHELTLAGCDQKRIERDGAKRIENIQPCQRPPGRFVLASGQCLLLRQKGRAAHVIIANRPRCPHDVVGRRAEFLGSHKRDPGFRCRPLRRLQYPYSECPGRRQHTEPPYPALRCIGNHARDLRFREQSRQVNARLGNVPVVGKRQHVEPGSANDRGRPAHGG